MKLTRDEFDVLTPPGKKGKGKGGSMKGVKPWPPADNDDDEDNESGDSGDSSGTKGKGSSNVKIKNLGKSGMGGTMTPEQSRTLQEEMDIPVETGGEDTVRKLIDEAAKHADQLPKDGGKGKGLLRRRIAELSRPKVDWKAALKRFIGKAMSNSESIMPNRRFVSRGMYLTGERNKYEALLNAVVAVDTSGSMSQEDITTILSETMGIIKAKKIKNTELIYFDDGIQGEPDKVKFPNPKFDLSRASGGGGTTFAEPLAYMIEKFKKNKLELGVFCTDGMNYDSSAVSKLNVPTNFKKVLIWIVMDMPEYEPPFGAMVIHISKRDLE